MLIRCQEKDCGVGINPAKDSLFDLTCGVPNCYLKQQMLAGDCQIFCVSVCPKSS